MKIDTLSRLGKTMRVHNEREADALIKEAIADGSIGEYDGSKWTTHSGELLFTLKVVDEISGKVEKVKLSHLGARLRRIDSTKDLPEYISPDVLSRAYMKLERMLEKKAQTGRSFSEVSRAIRAAGADESTGKDQKVVQEKTGPEKGSPAKADDKGEKEKKVAHPKAKTPEEMGQNPADLLEDEVE